VAGESVRDTLFGDLPLDRWPSEDADASAYPWSSFAQARELLAAGDTQTAKQSWYELVHHPGLESRHYAQAWTFLRAQGEQPPDSFAKHVYGVVVEMGLAEGLDLLAVYEDGGARYYNHAGGGVVIDEPPDAVAQSIEALLEAAAELVVHLGPWEGERPGPPSADHARLSLLTPSGLHFGEGDVETLSADPLGGPVLARATEVLSQLVGMTNPG
jgi:hypothetical protein